MQINFSRLMIAALLVSLPAARTARAQETAPGDSDVLTIRNLENVWAIAITLRDSTALAPILAREYVAVTAGAAHRQTRAQVLHEVAHPADSTRRVTQITFDSLAVHLVAPSRAIAQGAVSESGQSPGGPFLDRLAFVDTFVRRKTRWVCIASRVTPLPAHKA